jgi:NADH dehydrogenase
MTHVSAIGADKGSASKYASTKALGEEAVLETIKDAVILRPSIIFGPEDGFFNKFATMARYAPALPLIGGGATKFQPVYVGDVAEAIALSVDGKLKGGKTYELGGPDVRSFKELMEEMLTVIERKRILVPIPFWAARILGAVAGILPNPVITRDQVTLLESDNVVSQKARNAGLTLEGMGIAPQTLEAVLPTYLWRFRVRGQFQKTKAA